MGVGTGAARIVGEGDVDRRARAGPRDLPAPWGAIAWEPLAIRRNRSKAQLYFGGWNGRRVVLKDFGRPLQMPVMGGFARWTLGNEAAALRGLDGVPGVPRLLARSESVLVMEWVPGVPLSGFPPRGVPAVTFDRLEALLARIHAAGWAVGDLHRSNVLVSDDAVHLVDFALATAHSTLRGRAMAAHVQRLDRSAVAKLRRRAGFPLTAEDEALLARQPAWLRSWRRLKRARHQKRRSRDAARRARSSDGSQSTEAGDQHE